MPEADALARALDQPRHVGDDELTAVRRLDGSEHRRERRERIVGDLRPRIREARDERRLAGVRQPDERGVGEQLEPQLDRPLLPGQPTSAKRGVCRVGVAKRLLPRPPVPPFATTTRAPGCARSATSRSSSSSTCVPTGTRSTTSSPSAPCERLPPPPPPFPARSLWFGRKPRGRAAAGRRRAPRRRRRRRRRRPARPSGRTSSRRKWMEPSPPRPATDGQSGFVVEHLGVKYGFSTRRRRLAAPHHERYEIEQHHSDRVPRLTGSRCDRPTPCG